MRREAAFICGLISSFLIGTFFLPTYAQRVSVNNVIPGDAIDNDGDGLIDEEYCYNGIDEDGDGLLNEDCAYVDICPLASSTNGFEFVATFLDNQPDDSAFNPLQMFVARTPDDVTSNQDMFVNISTPQLIQDTARGVARIPAQTDIRQTIAGGQRGNMFDLPYQLRVTDSTAGGVAKKVVYVRTSHRAAVHGYNVEKYTADSFLTIPANALGREYYAATYVPSLLNTQVALVGLYTNTTVNVTLIRDLGEPDTPRLMVYYRGTEFENGQSFTITLNPFEVVHITSEYDMTGTRFTADLPFAVFAGNLRTWVRDDATESFIQSRDHLVEQMVPVESWGRRFVTRNYPPHMMADIVRVLASQPNTDVSLKIVNSSGTFDIAFNLRRAGMYRDFWLGPRGRASVVTSQPAMTVHLTHSQKDDNVPQQEQTDPSLIYVPPVTQFDLDYIFSSATYVGTAGTSFTHYVLLTARRGQEDQITLNGGRLEGVNWQEITLQGDSGVETYVQGYIQVPDGSHRLRSRSAFGAIQWSVGDRESVGTALGIRFKPNACVQCMQVICGDKVDNDCDGRIDEERCDGTDSDGDGRVDEDCACRGGRRQIYTHTTTTLAPPTTTTRRRPTTTPEPRSQVQEQVSPGLCNAGKSRGDCRNINVVFVADLTKTRLLQNNGDQAAIMSAMSTFLQDSINQWLPDSQSKFGVLAYSNGYPQISEALTPDRSALAAVIRRKFRPDMIADAESSDLALALRTARTDLFSSADANQRKVVVVLAFSPYSDRALISTIRSEALLLLNQVGADVYYIGFQQQRDEIARLSLSANNIFVDRTFDSFSQFSSPDQTLLSTITSACGDGFQSIKICYNGAQSLSCPAGRVVSILTANYGRVGFLGETTCGSPNPLNCEADDVACPYVDAYYQVATTCNGQEACIVQLNATLVASQIANFPRACRLAATYLEINYICADSSGAGAVPPCTYTPASRWLGAGRDLTITASSFASCLNCGTGEQDQNQQQCSAGSARSQCQPNMATFDYSASEAWCPSINGAFNSWIQADLGAPYVVLGVLVQGRRRLTTQYVSELNIQVSSAANAGFTRVATSTSTRRQTFQANMNSTDIVWIPFESNRTVARVVRIGVERYADHPALHFEVVINNRVRGCEAFRALGNSLTGQRGAFGDQRTVTCNGGFSTSNGARSYQTTCQENGRWSSEITCQAAGGGDPRR